MIKLDNELQDKIILNMEIDGPYNNDFYKHIDNQEIYNLEMKMRNKCINENSIYDDSDKLVINGYNCIRIKQNYDIYKSFNGFITYNQFNKYLNSDITKPSWFASKYVVYIRSRFSWDVLLVTSNLIFLYIYIIKQFFFII